MKMFNVDQSCLVNCSMNLPFKVVTMPCFFEQILLHNILNWQHQEVNSSANDNKRCTTLSCMDSAILKHKEVISYTESLSLLPNKLVLYIYSSFRMNLFRLEKSMMGLCFSFYSFLGVSFLWNTQYMLHDYQSHTLRSYSGVNNSANVVDELFTKI